MRIGVGAGEFIMSLKVLVKIAVQGCVWEGFIDRSSVFYDHDSQQ